MKITVKDQEITLKYGFKALMIYEDITDQSFNPKGLKDILVFFYSCFLASGGKDLIIGFDEFVEYLDENPQLVTEFSKWLSGIASIDSELKEKPKKTTKKNKVEK